MTFPDSRVIDALTGGDIELVGRLAWSSNATFLTSVTSSSGDLQAIYKPVRGERPLHDFPSGIGRREVASFELAAALGWDVIPETVMVDGPLGEGSLQRFVEVDYADHYFTMIEDSTPDLLSQLRRLCCFDLLANNTDRKSGHVLLDADRHVWGIDNALTFHAEFKLRTVIWDFAGEPIEATLIADIGDVLDSELPAAFENLLDPFERDAVLTRARAVVAEGRYPIDETGRRYPWPLV